MHQEVFVAAEMSTWSTEEEELALHTISVIEELIGGEGREKVCACAHVCQELHVLHNYESFESLPTTKFDFFLWEVQHL